MKKLITLVLALVCVLGLVGCNQKAVSASEVYSFPEPTTMITVSFYSQGEETAFEIGSEEYDSNDLSTTPVINWFYDLKLTACDEPEAVEGSESYEFYVKGESAFTYEDRGKATPGVRTGRGRQPYPRPERRVCFQRRSHYRLGQSRNAGTLA